MCGLCDAILTSMNLKKSLTSLLCILYITYSCPVPLMASTISGVTPQGNTYNIEAEKVSGSTGFRQYDTFDLTDGDIANLVYKDGYDKFLNMVDSQISINGIINTVRDGNFYNGRAIFVSSSGIVVGATGVLNVGSLSLLNTSDYDDLKSAYDDSDLSGYEYGADGYKTLVNSADGSIVSNGIILARGGVEADAATIEISGTADENGIVAGWDDPAMMFSDRQTAVEFFQHIVSGNVTDSEKMVMDESGTIRLTAYTSQTGDNGNAAPDNGITSKVTLDTTAMVANEIDINAKSELGSMSLPIVDFGKGVYFDYSKAVIGIQSSSLAAGNVKIRSDASTVSKINAIELPEVILAWLIEGIEDPEKTEENISSLFSSDYYDDFSGARAYTYVDIDDTTITADQNLEVTTDAQTYYEVKTTGAPEEAIPFQSLLHALGTETESIINVKNRSELTAAQTADIKALSGNSLQVQISNDNGLFRLAETDAFSFQYINVSTSVDTELNISDSTIKANEISARTLSNVDDWLYVENTATVLKNDFAKAQQGGFGAAVMGIVSNSKSKNEVNITDSTLESTGKDKNLSIEAVSVQNIDLSGKVRTEANGAKTKDKILDDNAFFKNARERFNNFVKIGKNAYSKYKSYAYNSWFGIFQQVNQKWSGAANDATQGAVGQSQQLDPGLFQVGGSFLFTNSNAEATVNITDSSLKSAQDLDITSHLLDKYHNVAMAHAKEPEDASQETAIIGAGIALVVNNRENDNNINIDSSTLVSEKDVNINAVTELPGNAGTIGLTSTILTLGLGFSTDAKDDWDFTFNKDIGMESDRESLMPKIGLTGFFNNASAAGTTGDKLAVAASVTYNNGTNSTNVNVRNGSSIEADNVRINSATSVATRSDAGFFGSSSIIDYDESYDVWNSDGTGASVLIQGLENNATINFEDSEITASADVVLESAAEQSYINFTKMFTDAPTIALGGAVSVQDYTGTTAVNISDNGRITADNIEINAGKSRASLGKLDFSADKKGLPLIENDRLVLADRRTVDDHITTADIVGEISKQESAEKKEVTAAVGAAVNVHTIDREVNTIIDDSVLTATSGNVTVDSKSYIRNVELALAGSLAGGAAAETQNVAEWQKKASKTDKSDAFFESMLAKIDNAFPVEEEIDEIKDGVEAAKDAASNVGGSKYSFAIAGSVNVLDNGTKVNNYIRNGSTITAAGEVDVSSSLRNSYLILSGGFAKSGTVGTGAAVNFLNRDGAVNSVVGGTVNDSSATTVTSGTKTSIDANEDNEIVSIAVGVGYIGDSQEPTDFDGAIGGSFTYNSIGSTTASTVNGAAINGNTEDGTDVSVHAKQSVNTLNFAGSLADENGSKFSAGAALAGTADFMDSDVGATVENTVMNDNVKDVNVLAEENDDLFAIGIALEAVGNYAKYGTPFDGSLGIVVLENDIHSELEKSLVNVSGNLSVAADNQVKALNAEGDGAYSGATSGLGVGGGWILDIQDNRITATIDPGSNSIKAGSVKADANSFERIDNIPVTVGISKSTSMLASTVVVDVVSNEVSATAKGDITSGSDVDINAKDESYLLTRGGTLAAAGGQATAVLGASVNVDKLSKTVDSSLDSATVNAGGKVTVSAESVDAIGGTRKDDGTYDRDDISDPNYQEKLLVYDDETKQYTDIKRDDVDNSFKNWNMFYNLGAGAKSAFTGAVVVKLTENDVNASLKNNSSVTSEQLLISAVERIVKNLMAGSISATQNLGVGVQVIYTKDSPVITARITDASTVKTTKDATVSASDIKDNNTIEVTGAFAGEGGALALNVLLNEFDDQVSSSIDSGSDLDVKSLSMNADEDVNSTRVLVQVTASENAAVGLEPVVNDYNEKVAATIDSATVKASDDSYIAFASEVAHKTRDIAIGVAAAAQGATLAGIEIRNNYNNNTDALINGSTVSDASIIDLNASNYIYTDNWAILFEGTAQGVEIGANVMINDVSKSTTAQIKDSTVDTDGAIYIRTNYDGNHQLISDRIRNTTGTVGLTAQGAALDANLILNSFSDVSKTTVSGGQLTADSLELDAGGLRNLDNTNITMVAVGEGAGLGGSVTYNSIASDTEASVATADGDFNITGTMDIRANDNTYVSEVTGTGAVGAVGGAATANVVIVKDKGISRAAITGSGKGMISAPFIRIKSDLEAGVHDESVGVSLGIGTLAGTVKLVTIGEKTDYTDLEKNAGLDSAVSGADERVRNFIGKSLSDDNGTGSYADINGNVDAKGNVDVEATSNISGIVGEGSLKLDNTDVTVAGASAGVGVLSAGLYHNSAATVSGGNVSITGGKLSLTSNTSDTVDVESTGIQIAGVSVSGGSASYNNASTSLAGISDAKVTADNISMQAQNYTESSSSITGITVGGFNLNVSGYESNVGYDTSALVTGTTDISTKGTLDMAANSIIDIKSDAQFDAFTGGENAIFISNNVNVDGRTNALVKDAEGTIDAGTINLTTSHQTFNAEGSSNVISVSGGSVTFVSGGTTVSPTFTSGIDNLDKDIAIKADKINIVTAQPYKDTQLTAKATIGTVGIAIAGLSDAASGAKATSNATSSSLVKSNNLTAGEINITADLVSTAAASDGGVSISTLTSIQSIDTEADATDTLEVEFDGNINVTGSLNVTTDHNSTTSASASSVTASLFDSVSILNLTSDNNTTTSVNLKGTLNVKDADFEINTGAYGQLDSSSHTGGAISADYRTFKNHVTGTAELKLDGLKASGAGNFKIMLSPTSTHDDVSISSNGGFYAYNNSDYDYNFDTKATVDIKNSDIGGFDAVEIDAVNQNIIKDSNVTQGGGFIFLANSSAGNTFSSGTDFTIEDSTISANQVTISAQAGNATDVDKEILFKGESGGFYTSDGLSLDNTLNQNNNLSVKNSTITAKQSGTISLMTTHSFEQKVEDISEGFIADPTVKSSLTSNSTNNLDIDGSSSIKSDGDLNFTLDVSGNLRTYSHVQVEDCGSDPETQSHLSMNADNTMTLEGTAEGGNSTNVIFMGNAKNDLHQESYSEHFAVAPFTTEGGELKRIVNNTLTVAASGRMLAGNSLNYQFNDPTGDIYASNHYHLIYYAAFGYETYGETSSNKTLKSNNTADVPGKMAAGIANGKFLFVTEDGSVDKKNSSGVYESDYFTYGDGKDLTPLEIKEKVVANIQTRIDSLNDSLDKVNEGLEYNESRYNELQEGIDSINGILSSVDDYLDKGYVIADESTALDAIKKDIVYELSSDDKHPPVSTELFDSVMANYTEWVKTEEAQGKGIVTDIMYYVTSVDTLLNPEQRETFIVAAGQVKDFMSYIGGPNGNDGISIMVYTNTEKNRKFVLTSNGTGESAKDVLAILEQKRSAMADQMTALERNHEILTSSQSLIKADIGQLNAELDGALSKAANEYGQSDSSYALLFQNLADKPGSITITGLEASEITIDGKRVGDNTALLSDHVYTARTGFSVNNNSDRDVIASVDAFGGNDGLRFIVNGTDISDIVTVAGTDEVSFVVHNDDISVRDNVDVQLYTAKTGNFSFHVDDSGVVHTTAPVVYSRPGLVVDGYLGYHSFDSFGYSEAANINSGFTLKTDIFPFIEDDDEEIIIRRDASSKMSSLY